MTTTAPLFSANIQINYEPNFITPAQLFIENLARTAGANEQELFHIDFALEEALSFIIDKFPDDPYTNSLDIRFVFDIKKNIVIEITNFGPPIHESRIPAFVLENEATFKGLWYKITKNVLDDFTFINNKNKGWIVRLQKKLAHCSFTRSTNSQQAASKQPAHLSVRIARPDDAPQLVDLAYETYRYSNEIADYYDIQSLKKSIREKTTYTLVVENEEKIIGASSIKFSKPNMKTGELSGAMIMPAYRHSTALLRLIKALSQYHNENPQQFEFTESLLVTTHTLSQRSVCKIHNGYHPFAFLLGMMRSPNYIAIKNTSGTFESLLNCYHLFSPIRVKQIFVPAEHRKIIDELLHNSGNPTAIHTTTEVPQNKQTKFNIRIDEELHEGQLAVTDFGYDWFNDLRKALFSITSKKVKSLTILFPTHAPLPDHFDSILAHLNLVFTGLHLVNLSDIRLNYMQIKQPIDFESIQVHHPVAKNLCHHIYLHYQKILLANINPMKTE